jgi:hypothetical protein
MASDTLEHRVSFWSDRNVLELNSSNDNMNTCTCLKNKCVHYKRINFMVCELYLNNNVKNKLIHTYTHRLKVPAPSWPM